jgi:hypothetical protein
MRPAILLLFACSAASCDRQSKETAGPNAAATGQVAVPAQAPVSKMPDLIPRPTKQAELDRLILAGYTPHDDHMHAPGAKECPMSKGTEAVM